MDILTIILASTLAFLLFLYLFLTKNYNYWESRGVACKEQSFLFGNVKDRILLKLSFHEFVEQFYSEMKEHKVAGLYEGSMPVLMVMDPEIIKNVLVKHFDHFTDRPFLKFKTVGYIDKMILSLKGNEWKRTRIACTPGFTSGKLKAMMPLINDCGKHLQQYLNNETKVTGEVELDARRFLIHYTLDAIATTCFGVNLDSFSTKDSEFVKQALSFQDMPILKRLLIQFIIMYQVPQWLTKHMKLAFFNEECIYFFGKTVLDTWMYRKENNVRRNDFLQLLLDAQAAPVEGMGEEEEFLANEKREVIDETTAMAQAVFFFLAAFETSSNHLTMACYELAKNKDIQQKAREEVLKHYDNGLKYESLSSMTYLEMVMNESLRLHSPIARLERAVTKPINLGGVDLAVGTKVVVPIVGLHHDPEYYPDPFSFKPERFSQEEKLKRNPYVFLAFGAGPRNCIGLRFANMSSKVCMSYLLKEYEIDICDKTPIPFEYDPKGFFLKSKHDIILKFRKIDS